MAWMTAVAKTGVLLVMRRWRLPVGSLTPLLTITMTLGVFPHSEYRVIPGAVLAGRLADRLVRAAKPSPVRSGAVRLCAFAVPAILYALYFIVLGLPEGIWWSIYLWAGSIVLVGIVGWLLSYLVMPPRLPEQREQASALA